MNQELVTLANCERCGSDYHPRDRYCRQCGVPLQPTATALTEPPRRAVPVSGPAQTLLGSRLAVIGILACVGPIGLPLLWFSHRFSRRTKIITTVIFFVLTIVLPIAVTYYCVEIALRPLLDALSSW